VKRHLITQIFNVTVYYLLVSFTLSARWPLYSKLLYF